MPSPDPLLAERLSRALDLASIAQRLILQRFTAQRLDPDLKADGSPVTETDRLCESRMRTFIEQHFPDDGVLGEEFPPVPARSPFRWILDPIDGTVSFAHGVPLFGTLIAVEHLGRPAIGVILMPALDELVYSAAGQGAWHRSGSADPTPCRVSLTADLASATVCVTPPAGTRADTVLDALARAGTTLRGWSDCYAHLLLATGRVDAVLEPVINPWDIAATAAILDQAGGRCTDWTGAESIERPTALATNGALHDPLLALCSPHAPPRG